MILYEGVNFYCVEETIEPQKWELLPDTLTIMGYLCNKAACDFRGRSYEAWYTQDIPINDGPYKFYGLPGLILRMEDSEKLFSFVIAGLEAAKNTLIVMDNKSGMAHCSLPEYQKLKRRMQETETLYAVKNRVLYESKRKLTIQYIPIESIGE